MGLVLVVGVVVGEHELVRKLGRGIFSVLLSRQMILMRVSVRPSRKLRLIIVKFVMILDLIDFVVL